MVTPRPVIGPPAPGSPNEASRAAESVCSESGLIGSEPGSTGRSTRLMASPATAARYEPVRTSPCWLIARIRALKFGTREASLDAPATPGSEPFFISFANLIPFLVELFLVSRMRRSDFRVRVSQTRSEKGLLKVPAGGKVTALIARRIASSLITCAQRALDQLLKVLPLPPWTTFVFSKI